MKKRKKDAANMFFSAFLVIAYVVCSYFLIQLFSTLNNPTLAGLLIVLLIVVFGLLMFYATRIGDGKQVLRFSPAVLVLMVLPSIYVISAFFAVGLPLHEQVSSDIGVIIVYMASMALGYGIPYTFTSGFELVSAEDVFNPKDEEETKDKKETSDKDDKEVKTTDKGKEDDKKDDKKDKETENKGKKGKKN